MNRLKIILPLLTAAVIGFIWVHSMMPGDISADESGAILRLIENILGNTAITEHIIRKTAHFTEYMLLGIICCGDMTVFGRGGFRYLALPLYICLFTAVVDESIQLFTLDRSGMLLDVWLDHSGSLAGAVCYNVIYKTVKNRR